MLSYKESLKILKETSALVEGHFILSSGLHSDKYIQCAKLLSKPQKAKDLCQSLAEKNTENFNNSVFRCYGVFNFITNSIIVIFKPENIFFIFLDFNIPL